MSRRKKHEEHESHDRWLVSYADFITLLFAFFVVLYATSTQNEDKEKQFEDSIRAKFHMVAVGFGGNAAPNMGAGPTGQVFDPLELLQRRRVGTDDLEDYVSKLLDKNLNAQEKKEAIAGVRKDAIGVRITLAASTFFPPGSAKLKQPAVKVLNILAKILKSANRQVIIEGHTDNKPVVGNQFESNWELASIRATTVVRYLINVYQMDPTKLGAVSYGDTRPLVPNTTEENRAKNRRIEIIIVNKNQSDEDSP
jgi:chemotaxis protein MotB